MSCNCITSEGETIECGECSMKRGIADFAYTRGKADGIREVIEQFEHLYVESFPEDWRWRDVIDVLKQKMSS